MSNEQIAEPVAQASGEGQGIEAELQELGRLAGQVDGFSAPDVKAQSPRNTDGIPSASKNQSADKADQQAASTPNSESEDPVTKEIKSLNVGEDREKSRNRLGQLWEQFNQKQREFGEQRAQFEREAEQSRSSRNEGYTPKELREFAKEWEEEGRDDLAESARKKAIEIEEAESSRSVKAKEREAEFLSRVRSNWDNLTKENPDLKDQGSDLFQTTQGFMAHGDPLVKDFLNRHPDGLVLATALAKLQLAGESAADAVKEVDRLKAENQKLRQKFSLGSSTPVSPTGDKSVSDMNTAEAENYLRSLVAATDGNLS